MTAKRDVVACCLAGVAAQESGHAAEAVAHFAEAVELAPQMLDVRLLLAYAQGAAGRVAGGRATLAATPDVETLGARELRRLIDAACQLGETPVALKAVRLVLADAHDDADLHATLGGLLQRTGLLDEATRVLHRAHLRWPRHVPTLMNRARLLVDQGAYVEAVSSYDLALAVDPRHDVARSSRGLLRLMMGDLEGGWRDHEARRSQPVHTVAVPRGLKAWDGKRSRGRTLLLWGEQGHGDQIQGVRFAKRLAAAGARVVVRCHSSLVRLFAGVDGVSEVVADGSPLPKCDAHVPMLSVPALLGEWRECDYGTAPYITPPGEPSSPLAARLDTVSKSAASASRVKIGLVWAGSPGHANDVNRSLPAAHLVELMRGIPAHWVSLQVGARASDISALPEDVQNTITDLSGLLSNFGDTAHALSALDRVVTVDTAVAHLAGAMGIPTLLLLPFVPDWRWQLARSDSPWYASVRVVRQPSRGDWNGVISAARRELVAGGQARAA